MSLLSRLRARRLSPADAAADARLVLVDVRDPHEYREGHAPAARNVPLNSLERQLGELAAIDAPIAFVCQSGMRSGVAVRAARRAGVEARNVAGGMLAWNRAGLPVAQGDGRERRARR